MKLITEKQEDVLNCIRSFIDSNGYPPTLQEITSLMGFSSINSTVKHLKALEKKSYLFRDNHSARGLRITKSKVDESNPQEIPLLGFIAAGQPLLAESHIVSYISIPAHLTKQGQRYYALRVQGESMIKAGIFHEDLVVVRYTNQANLHDIIVARIHDEVTVKRLEKTNEGFFLKSENDSYKNISPTEPWEIQGVVVAVIRDKIS